MPIPNIARGKIGVLALGSEPVDTEAVAPAAAASTAAEAPIAARATNTTNYPQVGGAVTGTPVAAVAPVSAVATFATMSAVTRDKLAVHEYR